MQVLTNKGALGRDKQLAVVEQLIDLVATATGNADLKTRTWVLLTEAADDVGDCGGTHTPTTNCDSGSRGDRTAPRRGLSQTRCPPDVPYAVRLPEPEILCHASSRPGTRGQSVSSIGSATASTSAPLRSTVTSIRCPIASAKRRFCKD